MPIDATQDPPPFGHLAREMSRFLERMNKGPSAFFPGEAWAPNVNLYETPHAYVVCVDLAGVDKETIDLTVVDGRLVLRGRREVPCCPKDLRDLDSRAVRARVHLMEIDHGEFAREVELPDDVHSEQVNAAHRNGLLWVEIPKREQGAGSR